MEIISKIKNKFTYDFGMQVLQVFALLAIGLQFIHSSSVPLTFDSRQTLSELAIKGYINLLSSPTTLFDPRIITWLSYYIPYYFFGYSESMMIAGNVLVHILNVLLLYSFFYTLLNHQAKLHSQNSTRKNSWIAFVGAALFGFHPLITYGVLYHIQRSMLLATFFSLLSLICLFKSFSRDSKVWMILSLTNYFFSIHSKEHAIMLPAVALLMILLFRGLSREIIKKYFPLILGMGLVALQVILVRLELFATTYEPWAGNLQKVANPENWQLLTPVILSSKIVFPLSIINQGFLFFKYLGLVFFPLTQFMSIDMPASFPEHLFSWPQTFGFVCFCLYPLCWFIFYKKTKNAVVTLAALFPWIMFFSELSVVRYNEAFVLYRDYLWMSLSILLIPYVLYQIKGKIRYAALLAFILFTAYGFHDRLNIFNDEITLWEDAANKIKLDDKSIFSAYRPYAILSARYILAGRYIESEKLLKKAIEQNPYFYLFYNNLAVTCVHLQKWDEAILNMKKVVELSPGEKIFRVNLAKTYTQAGRPGDAIKDFEVLFSEYPSDPEIIVNLAIAYSDVGQYEKSLEYYLLTKKIDPEHRDIDISIGNTNLKLGKVDESIRNYQESIQKNAKSYIGYYDLGIAYATKNDKQAALKAFAKSLEINPDFELAKKLYHEIEIQ